MSRERVLRGRIRTLHTLGEAVGALRSLSAQSFRAARERLPAVRSYRDAVNGLLGVLAPLDEVPLSREAPPALVLVAADLGLCGDYTAGLVREALALRAEAGAGPVFCLGRRALPALARGGVTPDRLLPAPTSVGALPHVLLPLVDEILALRRAGRLGRVTLVAARFEGAGHHTPIRIPVLPVAPPSGAPQLAASPYTGRDHLRRVVVREFLYVALTEALLEALASEHGKRLVIAEGASSWVDERIEGLVRQAAEIRREASTQEVIELVAASRAGRPGGPREGEGWTPSR
jgi:F-type H+-transporting ATPase subunit gamma